MTQTVNIQDATNNFSNLMISVDKGDEVLILRSDTPVAKLIPIHAKTKRNLGFLHEHMTESFFEPLSEEELTEWEKPIDIC